MKYFLGALAVVLISILAIVGIVRHHPQSGVSTPVTPASLASYADDGASQVTYLVQGRLVGNESRRSIRISVSQTSRSLEILNGYDEVIAKQQTLDNVPEAYRAFLAALQTAGFTNSKTTKLSNDGIGSCPLGKRYVYQLLENGETVTDLWNTSCADKAGSFNGVSITVRQLFQNQFPNYLDFVKNITL